MARRTTKKQPEAHKIDCVEVFAALRDLEKTKGIPVEYMVERMKQGMANAYRKDREDRRDVPADNVVVDFQESGLSVHVVEDRRGGVGGYRSGDPHRCRPEHQ